MNIRAADDGPCYYDGEDCDCGAFDVAGDCPRDPYAHEPDDLDLDEETIESIYNLRSSYVQEIFR